MPMTSQNGLSFRQILRRVARVFARGTSVKLDRIDIRILHELQKNGRITNVELPIWCICRPAPA